MKKINWTQWIALFVFASMGISVVFTIYEIFTAPIKQPATGPHVTLRGDYIFLLFEIILGIFILLLPSIIARRFKFEIPGLVYIFVYCISIRIHLSWYSSKILFNRATLG